MCKECNAHKSFYDGEIDAVYLLRQMAMNVAMNGAWGRLAWEGAILRRVINSDDITSVLMNVASFLAPIDDVELKKFRHSEKENKRLREG
jgi:hypothetical protein